MAGKSLVPFRPPNPALPYREDCWSEGETEVLIDTWGDRYVELNRGNLRQKQWQEVADAVNSRPCDARRPPRTDVQCKNRIDTLKKKYKSERSKILGTVTGSSQWKFYEKLDELIGSSSVGSVVPYKKPVAAVAPPLALPLPPNRRGTPLPTASVVRLPESYSFGRELSFEEGSESEEFSFGKKRTRKGKERADEEEGVRELSKAILRLAEIYERVEVDKQRQMMDLEMKRQEFAKGLEFQRMQIFVDSQMRIARMKKSRKGSVVGSDERSVKLDGNVQ